MVMARTFFDTEFTGLHQKTTIISIGLVTFGGMKFYAEFTDYDKSQVDEWIQTNVINCLRFVENSDGWKESGSDYYYVKGKTIHIVKHLKIWLSQFDGIEMWGDCLAYDWMLFCQLFGHAFNIPGNIYYIPFDICTLFKAKGIDPDTSREEFSSVCDKEQKHNALYDAIVIKSCYEKLINI